MGSAMVLYGGKHRLSQVLLSSFGAKADRHRTIAIGTQQGEHARVEQRGLSQARAAIEGYDGVVVNLAEELLTLAVAATEEVFLFAHGGVLVRGEPAPRVVYAHCCLVLFRSCTPSISFIILLIQSRSLAENWVAPKMTGSIFKW